MGWLRRWLLLDGGSRDALVSDRGVYDASCSTGAASRTSACIQLAPDGDGAVGGFGMDATELLPPFLPSYRCSDALFLFLLRHVHRDSVVAFLPETIEHWPAGPRTSRGAIWENTGLRVWDVVRWVISRHCLDTPDGSPTRRLEAVGRGMRAVAAARVEDFRRMMLEVWRQHIADWLAATEEAMVRHDEQPTWWADDVRLFRRKLLEELAVPGADIPRELGLEERDGVLQLQQIVRAAGELYEAWPAMWQCARRYTACSAVQCSA